MHSLKFRTSKVAVANKLRAAFEKAFFAWTTFSSQIRTNVKIQLYTMFENRQKCLTFQDCEGCFEINEARIARSVLKWDYFHNFQTLCILLFCKQRLEKFGFDVANYSSCCNY